MAQNTALRRRLRLALSLGILVCAAVLVWVVVQLLGISSRYRLAETEYQNLQQYAPLGGDVDVNAPDWPQQQAQKAQALTEINPAYKAWLEVPGAGINYPVVQGSDNQYYLGYTFAGEENPAGAIFLDSAHARPFAGQHTVLYGHNMKDGSMFGSLARFLNEQTRRENGTITVVTADGHRLQYQIFYAAATTSHDELYDAAMIEPDLAAWQAFSDLMRQRGVPENAFSVLTLSTCGAGGGEERVLVHAANVG